jgi:glycosyltransferase involved in cell wall biosynthesis
VSRLGIPAAKVTVVTPGIDDSFAPPSEVEVGRVRAAYRLDGPFLLAVGTLDARKGLATAARAAQMADLPLMLAGGKAASFTLATAPSGIRWLGRVPDHDLPGLYGSATALLYPSRYEGFGLPPLEAMACGAPVIASDIPALRETLSGASLLLAPDEPAAWAEAVRSLTIASGRAAELRAAGRTRATTYTWATAAGRLKTVLEAWPDAP